MGRRTRDLFKIEPRDTRKLINIAVDKNEHLNVIDYRISYFIATDNLYRLLRRGVMVRGKMRQCACMS